MVRELAAREYLRGVLGWKTTPLEFSWPLESSDVEVTHKHLFGVYAPDLQPSERALLDKMMGAISVQDYRLLEAAQFDDYVHVLCFSDEEQRFSGSSAKVWSFPSLSQLLTGEPSEIKERKMKVWEMLQQFQREVL